MPTTLHQVIAVEHPVKSDAHSKVTKLHRVTQGTHGPLTGIARTYTPRVAPEDGGEELPGESTRVQLKIDDVLRELVEVDTRLFDVIATKDRANCGARGDVIVEDGTVLLADVPVTYLLFLEKQLAILKTFIEKLPTLDLAESWHYDEARGCWATDPVMSTRTQKLPQNHVLSPATPQHPAQVHMFTVDKVVGDWRTIKFSGALPAERVAVLLARVVALQRAVTFAREAANGVEVVEQKVGATLFGWLMAA